MFHHTERQRAAPLVEIPQDSTHSLPRLYAIVHYMWVMLPILKLPVAENMLNRQFMPQGPNQVWGTDTTYLWTQQGWVYLAVVIDLYSRRVVGWSMDRHMQKALANHTLLMAINLRQPPPGLLHHSDRGSQYASHASQALLKQHGMLCTRRWATRHRWITKRSLTNVRKQLTTTEAAGLDVDVDVNAGKTESVDITPLTPGSYEFDCNKKLLFMKIHRGHVMAGTLVVAPASPE